MKRAFYSASIADFRAASPVEILGTIVENDPSSNLEHTQRRAWSEEIRIMKQVLSQYEGRIYFEYAIPRMGKRIDVLVITGPVIIVLEFKVFQSEFTSAGSDQVWDYALDLKNFHESSHARLIAPILCASASDSRISQVSHTDHNDRLLSPIHCSADRIGQAIENVLQLGREESAIDPIEWELGRYRPTPTIIEAAMALYKNHSVRDIAHNDAADNLTVTSGSIAEVIRESRSGNFKAICFVTGVPGAGKTLVGLNVATEHSDVNDNLYSVFLSGNGPLVAILREALARDRVANEKASGGSMRIGKARSEVGAFIQNVHHFRDECLRDLGPPVEHVALFDEAQRAWDLAQTASFMRRKKNIADFSSSEAEFLISCLDRHPDWAVVVCLVGGGQEINTGEAGIREWVRALNESFPTWQIYISSRLTDSEYGAGVILQELESRPKVVIKDELHLSVSMRSFRAENVSYLVKQLLDLEATDARDALAKLRGKYPIVITRDLAKAKEWLRERARGSERYGIVVSSQAERLKPHAIDVKSPVDPVVWFLNGKEHVRSSYYLEDVATEFDIQGLELDWACVTWDADFRFGPDGWQNWSFKGDRWERIRKPERQMYQKNAYRVLLTRARQGMVIVVPQGDRTDPTRSPDFYDPTFLYLTKIGFAPI
jgi:Schlafen group 3, DNA/RNA helicase domain